MRVLWVVALATALVAGGVGAWAVTGPGGAPVEGARQPGAVVASSRSAAGAVPGNQQASTGDGALSACRDEVRAGEAVASAGASSATHWRTHTQAQVLVDAGKIDVKESKARWAASKKFGPSDVANFGKADAAYQPKAGACERMGQVSVARNAAPAAACAKRANALADVARAARPITASWEHHQQMMKTKPHDEAGAAFGDYMGMWQGMVKGATPQLKAYDAAADALAKTPACPAS
ncbi:hypothetical protein [Luteipulveratus mongoliensis]|uniref:hypothetical protein n=1 Tax=Luteipulveratus mongoliensis TaxID=571913 RepID=UPI0012EEDEFF|nr:hypothetical protein [Luteipulveratus mongoliensis]